MHLIWTQIKTTLLILTHQYDTDSYFGFYAELTWQLQRPLGNLQIPLHCFFRST